MLAMVLSALAPTLAHAWVQPKDGELIEICSVSGMVWVKADGADASSPQPGSPMADMSQHCPWCSFHGASTGLPPSAAAPWPVSFAAADLPAWAEVISPGEVSRLASARGPPLAS